MLNALRTHWPEYLMEAASLSLFMIAACAFTVLLEHPMSWANRAIDDPLLRRGLMGIAMGVTAVALICSPWGKRSGAHLNPSVTLAFLSLGKISPADALFYIAAQFSGAIAGVQAAAWILGAPAGHSAVIFAATLPGAYGQGAAFVAEAVISSALFMAVLSCSNSPTFSRWTPILAGSLVAVYITVEAPVSGMSMNPARTLGSALFARDYTGLWIYFTAPVAGMLIAARVYKASRGGSHVFCAKLHHHNSLRCIFRCNYGSLHAKQ